MKNKSILILNLVNFVVSLGYSLILPVMPYYMESLGAGGKELGWLTAIYALMQTICAPFWGALSDRIGRKLVLGIGMLGYAVSLFLFGLASSIETLFIARGLSGILSSASAAAAMAYVGDSVSNEERSKNMGQLGAAMGAGAVIGPVIGGTLASFTIALPFFTGAAISFVAFILILVILPESLTRSNTSKSIKFSFMLNTFLGPAKTVLILIFLSRLCQTGFQGIIGLYLVDKFRLNTQQIGFVWMALAISLVLSQGILTGFLAKKFKDSKLIGIGLIGSATFILTMMLSTGFFSAMLILALLAVSIALTIPTLNASLSRMAEQNKGTVMGIGTTVGNLSKVIGPLLFGYLYEVNIELPYVIGGTIFFSASALCFMSTRKIPE
ncbi:MAG: MFS transporter [Hungatella sp.]|jgi:DHA1 family multidrug resistance protein-like MFS transporter|nr:MFS transporter [Hungatella sp.]